MTVRKFDFTVGPEQSAPPTVNDPSGPDDLITQGYADARYTQGSEAVADTVAIEAIAEAERHDGDFVLEKAGNKLYRFDSTSTASADGTFVLVPDSGSGRWIRITDLNKVNTFTNTTSSTSKDTGAMILEGGLGVEENINLGGNLGVDGNATVGGDLTVNGTTTSVNTDVLDVEDANITVNKGGTQATAQSNAAGVTVEMSDATDAGIFYDSALSSKFKAGESGTAGEILVTNFDQTATGLKSFNPGIQVDTLASTPAAASTDKIKIYAKDDGKVYKIDDAGNETELGSASGAGEINYIDNWNAETDTTGWATYADAAGAVPVDGTGGSPTASFAVQSLFILRGDKSFEFTKDAANRQGEGVSYDFTIKEQDISKKLKIQFDFKTNKDTAYTSGDLTVYIYDVTNSTLITPVDTDIIDGQNIFQTSFNSTTSTSYRLIFHIATTNASAWQAYIDNVIVGPGMTSQGAAVGPVERYSIQISDFTNNTGISLTDGRILYQRVGDKLHIDFLARFSGTGTVGSNFKFRLDNWLASLGLTKLEPIYGALGVYQVGVGGKAGNFFAQPEIDFYVQAVTGTSTSLLGTDIGNVAAKVRDLNFNCFFRILEWQGKGIVPMLAEDNLSEWQDAGSITSWTVGNGTEVSRYRRVGDSMEVQYSLVFGSASSANALTITIPNNLTIDSAKASLVASIFGHGIVGDATSPFPKFRFEILPANSTQVISRISDGTNNDVDASTPIVFTNGDFISFQFKVPILEWAGSQNSLVGYANANPDYSGLSTSYAPLIKNSVNSISANYTVQTNDGFSYILATTGGTDRTVTLPAAADNTGRVLTFKKVDSGTGYLIVDGAGSETIDGALLAYLPSQYDYIKIVSNGASWSLVDSLFAPLALTNQTQNNMANATVTDVSTGRLTIPPGKYLVSYAGYLQAYFNPQPTFVSISLRLTDLSNITITDDDGNGLASGEGAAQGETGAGGNSWVIQVDASNYIKTVTSSLTLKIRAYYRNSGGTLISGTNLSRSALDCRTEWLKIGL